MKLHSFWFARGRKSIPCFLAHQERKSNDFEKKQKTAFFPVLSSLPVDRQQLGVEDERGAAGNLGRGAHRACLVWRERERENKESEVSALFLKKVFSVSPCKTEKDSTKNSP